MPEARDCCGFGGTFAVKNADVSTAMLEDKLRRTSRPPAPRSCAAVGQLLPDAGSPAACDASGRGMRTLHVAEILAARGMSFPSTESGASRSTNRAAASATCTRRPRRSARKRTRAVAELPDWDELRDAGAAIKAGALATLPEQLERLEAAVTARGGTVHWARDAAEANATVAAIAVRHGAEELIKVKSITTDEIELNDALAKRGITAHATDLAELVNQLAGDWSSHILVPAIHRNRDEIRALFERTIASGQRLDDDPSALTATARAHLRELFLRVPFAVSGANFAIAETGTTMVVESEGNGRMCTTLPQVLVTVMGIEKVLPSWRDLEVFLQLLPRSSTGERMNPYTSLWSGVGRATAPRSSTSCCSTTAAPTCWPTRSGARRCTASAARPVSTSARCTRAWAATPTTRSIRGRSERS